MTVYDSSGDSESELRRAVACSTCFRDVLHNLGLVGAGGNYEVLKRRIHAAGIDISHFRSRRGVTQLEDQNLANAIVRSTNYAQALRRLGVSPGAGYRLVRERVAQLGLSVQHFTRQGQRSSVSVKGPAPLTLEEVLVQGRPTRTSKLRERLVREGILVRCCSGCGFREWEGVPILLEFDHANGIRDDNRLANLRLLCPNCHAQTPTYRGRNIGMADARRRELTSSKAVTACPAQRAVRQQPTQLSFIACIEQVNA